MKRFTKALNIIAIVLNTIFLAGILCVLISFGAYLESLRDLAGSILIIVLPAVTLVTIALTFRKEGKKLISILRIIAIIVNTSLLVILICEMVVPAVKGARPGGLAQWLVCIMGLGLPVINVLTLVLTFRKGKAEV